MGSIEATGEAQALFNRLFDCSYDWFDARVPHDWAQKARYEKGDLMSRFSVFFDGGNGRTDLEETFRSVESEGRIRPYSLSESYSAGEVIQNPKFGLGVVESVERDRIQVRFDKGTKALKHCPR